MSLEEWLYVVGFFVSGMNEICVRCRDADEIIGSSALDFLPDFLHLEVHCFRVKGDRSRDIVDGLMGIV